MIQAIKNFFSSPKKTLVVSETATSNYSYHLRQVMKDQKKLSPRIGPALCGATLGWDTKIPLSAYMKKDGYSHWCKICYELAEESQST